MVWWFTAAWAALAAVGIASPPPSGWMALACFVAGFSFFEAAYDADKKAGGRVE
jgi:4-hydroxybenzoate polyprenyltransferase